jgi:VWFA-related protein
MRKAKTRIAIMLVAATALMGSVVTGGKVHGQSDTTESKRSERNSRSQNTRGAVRAVTIPVTIRPRGSKAQKELQALGNYTVREDGEAQRVLSVRSIGISPLSIAILIQDGVVPSVSSNIGSVADFVRRLPRGSRVLVGYIRSGSLQVRQKFTTDLDRAADNLRPPVNFASASSFNPYVEIIEGLKRFDSLPTGRRAMLVVSDGLDISRGLESTLAPQSLDLERAIKEAQRRSVAIYAFYAPTVVAAASNNQILIGAAQGSLERLSKETGGHAFFQGMSAPVSYDPFLRELATSLTRQIALTYLSTHSNKGYHRIEIILDQPDVEIDYPVGYTR